jgi:hypothetical protein
MSDTDTTTDETDETEEHERLDPTAEPDEDTKKEIEEERDRRLDPESRPEGAEIDNTPREFDVERGQFTDSDDYDESEPAPFKDPEDPNNDEG